MVFLLGAGRSGTTLLYKLLSLHPDIAYITNYENRFGPPIPWALIGRTVRSQVSLKREMWFDAGGNAYMVTRRLWRKLFPAPCEGEAVYRRCGIPLLVDDTLPDERVALRLRRSLERIRAASGCPVLLSKRTANNRRIEWLAKAFPEARFIHVIRDGREVAHSLRHVEWWHGHTVFWARRTPTQMEAEGVPALEICARNWVEEVEAIRRSLGALDPAQSHKIRYEDLVADPVTALERTLAFLGLSPTEAFTTAVNDIGLAPRPPAWKAAWSAADQELVTSWQGPLLTALNYR
jgi:hypothetical protein